MSPDPNEQLQQELDEYQEQVNELSPDEDLTWANYPDYADDGICDYE